MEPTPPSSSTPPSVPAPEVPTAAKRPPPLPQLVTELRDLLVRYFREQTLVPLRKLGRYIGFGVLGSLLLGFGVVFLGMAGLRALQDETGDTFSGDWSWVPYLIMFVALLFGAGLVWVARTARRAEKEYG
jgi:uncharacterized BrkB/YihY/UPF0761 family membrane protein